MLVRVTSLTTLAVLAVVGSTAAEPAQGAPPPQSAPNRATSAPATPPTIQVATLDAAEAERRIVAVYEQVSPAVVRIEGDDGVTFDGCTGVTVTAEGHVLMASMSSRLANMTLKFLLPGGRTATGKMLGRSHEWGVALAKLDGDGPWPHVKLVGPARVRAGQPVVTLAYSLPESKIVHQPQLDVEWVNRSAAGLWFMRPDGSKYEWKMSGVAFDLDGRIVGIESASFAYHGSAFTHVELIRSLWDDLLAGKNVDQVRLAGGANADKPDAPGPAKKTAISKEVREKASAATVQIRRQPGAKGVSGVIISQDGVVATVAHHFVMPGGKVIVSLPDGRDVAGEVVGISLPGDVGLVRITEAGIFPHVETGDSHRLRPGDPCLAIGYGPVGANTRQPQARATQVVELFGGRWSHVLPTDRSARFTGGDCGGGVFDAEGRLVAIADPHMGLPWPHEHRRIEILRKQWDELHAPFEQADVSEFAPVEDSIQAAADRVRPGVVEVLDGDKPVALGTVVSADGLILTKASVLPRTATCRLVGGRVLPATVIKIVREHDLAVLKVEAAGLPVVQWSSKIDPPVGTLVGLAGPSLATGSIASPTLSFPSERGLLGVTLQDGERGLEVVESGTQPLRQGDLVLSVDGRPTANRKELRALLDVAAAPIAIAGDQVRLVVKRDGERTELDLVLAPPTSPSLEGQSARCSGFSRVYSVAASPKFDMYGGPVLDREGRAIGIAIAARQKGWILVLPAATARSVAAHDR